MKKIIICLSVFLLLATCFFTLLLNIYNIFNDNLDACLDSGICQEGIIIITKFGKIRVEKESCIKYNWRWIEDKNYCILK